MNRAVSRDGKTRKRSTCALPGLTKRKPLNQCHIHDSRVLKTILNQQNTKILHQELNEAVEDYSGSQLKAKHPCSCQVRHLFCIGLNPLSRTITKSCLRYRFRNGTISANLIYMDDIKLYVKSECVCVFSHRIIKPNCEL